MLDEGLQVKKQLGKPKHATMLLRFVFFDLMAPWLHFRLCNHRVHNAFYLKHRILKSARRSLCTTKDPPNDPNHPKDQL